MRNFRCGFVKIRCDIVSQALMNFRTTIYRERIYIYVCFSLRFNVHDTKNQKQAETTRYVCEFSNRKTGGYDCKASFRAKKFHHNGSVTVEKSDAEHDDNPQADDQRVYGVYTKKFDQKIEDCINLRMKYFQIKATLKKDGLFGEEVDTAEGRKKLYAKVHRIKVKLGKGRLLILVRKQCSGCLFALFCCLFAFFCETIFLLNRTIFSFLITLFSLPNRTIFIMVGAS